MNTRQMLWRLIRFSRVSYFWTVVLQIPRRLLPLAPALIVQQIIDGLTHGMQLDRNFWSLIGLFLGLVLLRMMVLVIVQLAERFPIFNIETLLRKNLLEHLLHQPGAQQLPYATGDIRNCSYLMISQAPSMSKLNICSGSVSSLQKVLKLGLAR